MSTIEWNKGYTLGCGLQAITNAPRASAIEDKEPEDSFNSQTTEFRLRSVESTTRLTQLLTGSVTAEVDTLTTDVSAKANFVSHNILNRYSFFLLASIAVVNSAKNLTRNMITPNQIEVAKDTKRFERSFGTRFVSGVVSGGEYFGLIRIDTESEADFLKVKADLDVDVRTASADVDFFAQFEKTMSRMQSNGRLKVESLQIGGNGADAAPPTTPKDLLARVSDFPQIVTENPSPFQALTLPYAATLNWPDASDPTVTAHMQTIVGMLNRSRMDILERQADLTYAMANLNQFETPTLTSGAYAGLIFEAALEKENKALEDNTLRILASYRAALEKPEEASFPGDFAAVEQVPLKRKAGALTYLMRHKARSNRFLLINESADERTRRSFERDFEDPEPATASRIAQILDTTGSVPVAAFNPWEE